MLEKNEQRLGFGAIVAALALASGVAVAGGKIALSGSEEVPAVTTDASGTGSIVIKEDKSVTGSVTTQGVLGVAAHIHLAPAGKNGPPVITLTKKSDNEWSVPEGSKLSDEQYAAYKAGELYVNVHSAANKSGEIRAQLKP